MSTRPAGKAIAGFAGAIADSAKAIDDSRNDNPTSVGHDAHAGARTAGSDAAAETSRKPGATFGLHDEFSGVRTGTSGIPLETSGNSDDSSGDAYSGRWQVTRTGVGSDTELRWSANGQELFFTTGGTMFAASVSGGTKLQIGEPRALFSTPGLANFFDVYPDGSFLMVRSRRDRRNPGRIVMVERWTDLLPK